MSNVELSLCFNQIINNNIIPAFERLQRDLNNYINFITNVEKSTESKNTHCMDSVSSLLCYEMSSAIASHLKCIKDISTVVIHFKLETVDIFDEVLTLMKKFKKLEKKIKFLTNENSNKSNCLNIILVNFNSFVKRERRLLFGNI